MMQLMAAPAGFPSPFSLPDKTAQGKMDEDLPDKVKGLMGNAKTENFIIEEALGIDGELSIDEVGESKPPDPGEADAAEEEEEDEEDDTNKEFRANDPACALCDDGGEILSCDGTCMRSFHIGLSEQEFSPALCNPLDMPRELSQRLLDSHDVFECPNCVTNRHQCYVCKKEGNSSLLAPPNEDTVRRCAIFECGKFYHPRCIQETLSNHMIACPLHKCALPTCKAAETGEPLIGCRRCPVAYHEQCMPKRIMDSRELDHGKRLWLAKLDNEGNVIGDSVDRSLLYCMKHKIKPGEDNPDHAAPIFSSTVMKAWRLHYANKFPELSWSISILQEEKKEVSQRKARTVSQETHAKRDAADTSGSVKRRRIEKRQEIRKETDGRANGSAWLPPPPSNALKDESELEETLSSRASSLRDEDYVDDPALFPFEQDRFWSEEAMNFMIDKDIEEIESEITFNQIEKATRKPEPYTMPFKKTITEARLAQLKISCDMAKSKPGSWRQHINGSIVKEMRMNLDCLQMMCAPFIHGSRYSSYGRHFTNTEQLITVARKLEVFVEPGDTCVDFSCGANEFLPMFKQYCIKQGKRISCKAFDIIAPAIMDDFFKTSWFDVSRGMMPKGDNLIIGLNPPYGKDNILAKKFTDHAASFGPRIIVLIVPPGTPIPTGYETVLEDRTTMSDKSFYIPGLQSAERGQWNKITPAFRVLARRDLAPLSEGLHAKHMTAPSWSYSFHEANEIMRMHSGMAMAAAPFNNYANPYRAVY